MRSTITWAVMALMAGMAAAEIPQVMSYQGKVTDAGGAPVADGPNAMQFQLYEQETGGSPVWDSGTQTVGVMGGIFSVLLGGPPQPPIGSPFVGDAWLEVTIGGDLQTPRVRLGSVGYAYMASGLVPGTEVIGPVVDGPLSAIKAVNTATAGYTYGGLFENDSPNGLGVCGRAWATTAGDAAGGHFSCGTTEGRGVVGLATATTGSTFGVYGRSDSEAGSGVFGVAMATSGITSGGRFEATSSSGSGVVGQASSTEGFCVGVVGQSNSDQGVGVFGIAAATTGTTSGVYGRTDSNQGSGVVGATTSYSGVVDGVRGETWSDWGRGVVGKAIAMTGPGCGVYGESASSDGRGVYGMATATTGGTFGVRGQTTSDEGIGVYGYASAVSGDTYGGWFEAASAFGEGVVGTSTATTGPTTGVLGLSSSTTQGCGVEGAATATSGSTVGVWGSSESSNGIGVYGRAYATSGETYGVYGRADSPSGYGLYAQGNFAASGSKSCVVKTSRGPTLLYCQESPENWFEDFGRGQLTAGKAHIEFDPLFLETVTIDESNPHHVFLQPLDPSCKGLAAVPSGTGFDVIELLAGTSDGTFCYRVVAKRKGYEIKRLDYCKAAETDAHLYPELRDETDARFARHRVVMPEGVRQRVARPHIPDSERGTQ